MIRTGLRFTALQLRDALRLARTDEWSLAAIGMFAVVVTFLAATGAMLIQPGDSLDLNLNGTWAIIVGVVVILLSAPGFFTEKRNPVAEIIGGGVFGTAAMFTAMHLLAFATLTDYVMGAVIFGLPAAACGAYSVARPLMALLHAVGGPSRIGRSLTHFTRLV